MNKIFIVYFIAFFSFLPYGWGNIDIQKTIIDGKEYVAFTPDDAKYLLELRIKFPVQQEKIKGLEDLVLNKTKQIKIMDTMLENKNQQVTLLTDRAIYLEEELDSATAWYRSPYLWTAIGIVLGCVATISIVKAVD